MPEWCVRGKAGFPIWLALRNPVGHKESRTCHMLPCVSLKDRPWTNRRPSMPRQPADPERNFGKGSIMRLGKSDRSMDVETISSGSLGLDIALGVGGLPRGRVVEPLRSEERR